MSLSVPYVLRAAVQSAPQTAIAVSDGELTVEDLDLASAEAVRVLLRDGFAPGMRRRVVATGTAGTVQRLAAARMGLVLSTGEETAGEPLTADLAVLEQRVWSETVLVEGSDAHDPVTHGDVVRALVDGAAVPDACPQDLAGIVAALLGAGFSVPERGVQRP